MVGNPRSASAPIPRVPLFYYMLTKRRIFVCKSCNHANFQSDLVARLLRILSVTSQCYNGIKEHQMEM